VSGDQACGRAESASTPARRMGGLRRSQVIGLIWPRHLDQFLMPTAG
jgi:hypothetical protein